MKNFLVSSLLLGVCSVASSATLVGLWEFENSSDLTEATTGSALSFTGSVTTTTGVSPSDGAAIVARDASIQVSNPIGANGASGSPTRTNQFTIVIDFKIPDFTDGGADNGQFTGILDFRQSNSDGDYFIRKQANAAELGVSNVGYTGAGSTIGGDNNGGTFLGDTWYRLVYAVDTGGTGRSTYLNGALIGNNNLNNTLNNTRASLGTVFGVFQDNTLGEQSEAIVSSISLYDGKLSDVEVEALGGVPEPSSTLLIGLGSLALIRRRRQ